MLVEQKNGAVVRRLVGYDRYEGLEAARVLGELYDAVRLYVNYFQPSRLEVSARREDEARIRRASHSV